MSLAIFHLVAPWNIAQLEWINHDNQRKNLNRGGYRKICRGWRKYLMLRIKKILVHFLSVFTKSVLFFSIYFFLGTAPALPAPPRSALD